MVLSQSLPRTQGPFLMATLRTGFELITSANLQGRRSRKHRFRLKAPLVERHKRLFHARHIFDGGERKRREVILKVFDK